jgi:hypothetical protein
VEGIAPLDAALGLPAEHYGYDVGRIIADEVSRSSYDEVAETLAKHTHAHVPKRQIEELAIRCACDRLLTPEATAADHLLVLSFDGKGIAMLHEHLREPTRRKAAAASRKLQTRLAKGEKPNAKRMAQVATVYSVAPYERTTADVLHGLTKRDPASRPAPTNKRVWASIEHSMQRVIDDHEREPPIALEWEPLVKFDDRTLLLVEQPVIARDERVVLVGFAVALAPLEELAAGDPEPRDEAVDGDLGLVVEDAGLEVVLGADLRDRLLVDQVLLEDLGLLLGRVVAT